MLKNNKTFWYQAKEDVLVIGVLLSIYAIILFSLGRAQIDTVVTMDIMIIFNNFTFGQSLSYNRYNQYIVFGFSRRKFYKEQVINAMIRSGLLSAFRSGIQWIYVEEYKKRFFFEESTLLYEKVPFVELFITNLCAFLLIHLFLLITSTAKIDFTFNVTKGYSLQLKQRMKEQKKKLGVFCNIIVILNKVISFIMTMICGVFAIGYYEIQMTNPLSYRIVPLIIMAVASTILYFIGRKRFKPEYI